jgi:hypothetical protein
MTPNQQKIMATPRRGKETRNDLKLQSKEMDNLKVEGVGVGGGHPRSNASRERRSLAVD